MSLGCGGVERDTARSGDPPSGGGATSSGTDAGATGSGGSSISSGGSPFVGGHPGAGGAQNAGGANTYLKDSGVLCVPAQWDCSGVSLNCAGVGAFNVSGYEMPTGCRCDVTRPGAGSDCPSGWTFACRNAISGANGELFQVRTPFDCTCIAPTTECPASCDRFSTEIRQCDVIPRTNGGVDVLCGCAVVTLR